MFFFLQDLDKAMQIMAQVDHMIENLHVTSSLDAVLKKHIGFIQTMKKVRKVSTYIY